MAAILEQINRVVWGIPVLTLILIVGILLTLRSGAAQIRLFPEAFRQFIRSFRSGRESQTGMSGYRALCTALAATVGTGNIAGVAGAIAIGGPGVIFWMWICAFVGMITKCAEVTLAVHYRQKKTDGTFIGGPMYIIKNGLPDRIVFLAFLYAYFGIVAALGIGNAVQINAVADGIRNIAASFSVPFGKREAIVLGVGLAVLIVPVFLKGASRIGSLTEKLVPFASAVYVLIALAALILRANRIPEAFGTILRGAFSPKAATGGVLSSVFLTLRVGVSRGIFTNEAGMGTASIAHASSQVVEPLEQGLMGIMEVFLDTVVICSLTALVILTSGISIQYGMDPGIFLTMDAFSAVLGNWSKLVIAALTSIFAFATLLGWGFYGASCCQFLFGENAWKRFAFIQAGTVILGSVLQTSVVWVLSEIVNGLMAIPNLIALLLLSGVFLDSIKKKANKCGPA